MDCPQETCCLRCRCDHPGLLGAELIVVESKCSIPWKLHLRCHISSVEDGDCTICQSKLVLLMILLKAQEDPLCCLSC